MQGAIDRLQVSRAIHLEPEMRHTGRPVPGRSCEIKGRIIDPPIRVGRAAAAWARLEQIGIEPDSLFQVIDPDMYVQALHDTVAFARLPCTGLHPAAGARFSGGPPQQFSVRKPSSAFMVSKRAA